MTIPTFSGLALRQKTALTLRSATILRSAAAIAAVLSLSEAKPLLAQTPAAAPPAAPAAPAKAPLSFGVSARVSTLGLGLEVGTQLNDYVALRLGYNGYSYRHSAAYQSVDYDAKLKLSSVSALADLYAGPHTGLHLTGGFLFNSSKVTALGKPGGDGASQTYQLNSTAYAAGDVGSLNGSLTFNKVSPYLGIGFSRPYGGGSGLSFISEIGIVFQGKPKLSLTRSGGTTDPTLGATINSDLSAQQDKTQSDVNKFQYYPVVSFGLAYHF